MASWSRTCAGRAAALRMSSLTKLARFGYRVRIHLRLRSVPGRLRLSRRVTYQPPLIRWAAVFTPRKPAPPVINARRSALEVRSGSLRSPYRALGSIAAETLSRRGASEEGDGDYPRRSGKHERLAALVATARVEVRAGYEKRREDAVDHVQDAFRRIPAADRGGQAEQALDRRERGHDQVARAEPATQPLVAEVEVRAPDAEDDREDDEDAGAERVQQNECLFQSGDEAADLLAEVVDGQAQPFLELHAWLPAELLGRPPVVESDPVHVALSRRAESRLLPVFGEERELAEHVVDHDRDAGAHVERASVSAVEGREVGHRHVADVDHVARLRAVTVDGYRLALDHPAREDRNDASLLGEEVLPRAVDICVAQRGEVEAEGALERGEVLLERELARAVRRQGTDRMVLVRRHHVRLAVEGSPGGAEDHLADVVVEACAQDVESADDVDLGVEAGVGHRLRHLGLGRLVVDDLRLEGSDRLLDLVEVADVGAVD